MKFKQISLGMMATLLLTTVVTISFMTQVQAESKQESREKNKINVTVGNSFISLNRDRPTQGRARIISYQGKHYLEFDQAFSTVSSSELKVILYRHNSVPKIIQAKNYLHLAPLASLDGQQRYLIPETIELRNYQTVAIWSANLNTTLAYAALPKITTTLAAGNFVTVESNYPTQGTASIIEEHGKKYLEFNSQFATELQNDLKVMLHRHNSTSSKIKQPEYFKLASLKSCRGKQRYLLPSEINVKEYASVIVWSDKLKLPVGYANL